MASLLIQDTFFPKYVAQKYLEQEVLNAPPQKLRLLLIEGAIRNIARAKQLWSENREQAGEAIVRAQEIVAQLLAGMDPDRRQPLLREVAAIYTYVFRTLAIAHLQQHEKSLDDAVRVLEVERETWRQLCEQMGVSSATLTPHFTQPTRPLGRESSAGISFEA